MATKQLAYFIYLTDPAQVEALVALYPLGRVLAPDTAATEYGAPYRGPLVGTSATEAPCIRTPFDAEVQAGRFPTDRAFFTLNEGWWRPGTQKYAWTGFFFYVPPPTAIVINGEVTTGTLLPLREVLWADGFEWPGGDTNIAANDSGSPLFQATGCTRIASRTTGGYGLLIGGADASTAVGGEHSGKSGRGEWTWERLHVQVARNPDTDVRIWELYAPNSQVGTTNENINVVVNSSGGLAVRYNSSSSGAGTQLPIFTVDPIGSAYRRLDIVAHTYTSPGTSGRILVSIEAWLYVDGVLAGHGAVTHSDYSAMSITTEWTRSKVGTLGTTAQNGQIHLDDWSAYALDAGDAATWLDEEEQRGLDWHRGSRVVIAKPKAMDASTSGWTGNYQETLQENPATTAESGVGMESTTSGALLAVELDVDEIQADDIIGFQGFTVGVHGFQATSGTGSIGYDLDAAGPVDAVLSSESVAPGDWMHTRYFPSGEQDPWPITSLVVRKTKAANTNAAKVRAMGAAILAVTQEIAAAPDVSTPPARPTLHNAPYAASPWGRPEVPTDAPVYVIGGTYVGSDAGVDLTFPCPVHFMWVRPLASANGGARWWSSSIGTRRGTSAHEGQSPQHVRFTGVGGLGGTDTESRCTVSISGGQSQHNDNGVTYQYIAVCDPGARFVLNGALRRTGAASFVHTLEDAGFEPLYGFFSREVWGSSSGVLYLKGPGHTTNNAQAIDAAESTGRVTWVGAGEVQVEGASGLNASGHAQTSYSLWRTEDGSDENDDTPVAIFSYTGDAAASRTISVPPSMAMGRRPLFAIITPHNSTSIIRDPSHTTNTSSSGLGSTTTTTGITAGAIDQFTVGSTLNASGVVYEVFIIWGGTTAGNGGWSANGEFLYDPVTPTGDQWDEGYTQDELDDLENPPDTGGETGSFDDGPDLVDDLADTVCVPFTLRACNLALARIGVSDILQAAADLLTPTSREHTLLAQFYESVLRFVLRDFPWPHATRYANPELIEGSLSAPVNADWVYAWRQPAGSLFVRRIVRPERGRKFDPNPPAFRVAEAEDLDGNLGPIIYTTEDGVQFDSNDEPFIEIEYTVRPPCGARAGGDQAFVSCLAWRLAYELAGPLSRDKETIQRCERSYVLERNTAGATTAREQQQQPAGDASWITDRGGGGAFNERDRD